MLNNSWQSNLLFKKNRKKVMYSVVQEFTVLFLSLCIYPTAAPLEYLGYLDSRREGTENLP